MGMITTVTTHYELVIPFWAMAVHRKHGACLYDCSIRPCRTLNSLLLQDKREWCVTLCIFLLLCFVFYKCTPGLGNVETSVCAPSKQTSASITTPHLYNTINCCCARQPQTSYACNSIFEGKQCFVYIICGTLAINSMLNLAVEKHAVGV